MKRKAALEEQARRSSNRERLAAAGLLGPEAATASPGDLRLAAAAAAKAASLAATALLQSLAAEKERLWDQVEEEERLTGLEEAEAADQAAELYYQAWQEAEEEEAEAEAQLYYKVWQEAEEEEAAAEATELYWQRAEDAALELGDSELRSP